MSKRTSTQAINVKCIEIIVTKNGGRRKTSNHPSFIPLCYEENLKVYTSFSCFGNKKPVLNNSHLFERIANFGSMKN
jgi:hypothetical protein